MKIIKPLLCGALVLLMLSACAAPGDQQSSTDPTEESTQMQTSTVYVTDSPYNAAGDGVNNDRKAIQAAIDDMHLSGGGTVVLTENTTFLSSNLILKSNVELRFADGAVLKQSTKLKDYIKPEDGKYVSNRPYLGHNTIANVRWGHAWYQNFPLIYAGEGTSNVKITGSGIIEMTPGRNCDETLHLCPIGLYRVDGFVVSDVTITHCSNYGMMPFTCKNGLIQNVTMKSFVCKNGDGISLQNCQDIRITGCNLDVTDDAIYIFTSYADPRGGAWWSSNNPQPSKNIEIDHNVCITPCKGFAFILWGSSCPDQSLVEVSNVYVHDNAFSSMGIWNDDPYDDLTIPTPVKNVRFENNEILKIQENFYQTPISDMNFYPSMPQLKNGDFSQGGVYWIAQNGGATEPDTDRNRWGYIDCDGETDSKLYQGLYLEAGIRYSFSAQVMTEGGAGRLFVRNLDTQELIASVECNGTDWTEQTLSFTVNTAGNYHIGIENVPSSSGRINIRDVELTASE